jgi:hypothetical protein
VISSLSSSASSLSSSASSSSSTSLLHHPINIITPLKVNMFNKYLTHNNISYPKKHQIIYGLTYGFHVGYHGKRDNSISRIDVTNHTNKDIDINDYDKFINDEMEKELLLKRRISFDKPIYPNTILHPLGVVTKKFSSKLRLVHDYSYPQHGPHVSSSVNYNIPNDKRETHLSSFDEALQLIINAKLNNNYNDIYLSKIDIESAYRLIPLHPNDYHLLGMKWKNKYYYDLVAPFGLASSCQIWEEVATCIQWIIHMYLVIKYILHYVDDYLLVSNTLPSANKELNSILGLCKMLGVPISKNKLVRPCKQITFLGIGINITTWTIYIDSDRLLFLQNIFTTWSKKTTTTIRELQSL